MSNSIPSILLLATIGSIAGLIGGVVFLVKKSWSQTLCKYAVPFAAGVLLSVSLLHLLPEAVHDLGDSAYLYLLVAFLLSFLFEQFFAHLHHHETPETKSLKHSVPLVLFGDTIHNFIDGVAIGAAYLTDPMFGFVVAFATFLHETPHEIGDFGVLVAAGWSEKKTFIANFLSALATFPGAFLVLMFTNESRGIVAILLAISAGVFLYLGASDFLPMVGEEEKGANASKKIVLLIAGVVIMYLLTFFTPEHISV